MGYCNLYKEDDEMRKIFYSLFAFILVFANFYVLESSANASLSNFEQGSLKP